VTLGRLHFPRPQQFRREDRPEGLPWLDPLANCSAAKAEENERSTFELCELRRSESPHPLVNVGPSHCRQLVDHQKAGLSYARGSVGRDGEPQERSVDVGRGERTDRHRIRFEAIVLDDQCRARFGCVDAVSNQPDLSALHSTQSAEIASTKA
jgi:hypothetical protein